MDTIHEYGRGTGGGSLDKPAVEIHLWRFCVQRCDVLLRYDVVIFPVKPAVNALFGVELSGFRMTAIELIMTIIIIKEMREKWYTHTHTHTAKSVYEQEDVTVLWNQAVHSDREVTANMPNITIKTEREKTRILMYVAIPADRNFVQVEAAKKLKYESLCIDIQ